MPPPPEGTVLRAVLRHPYWTMKAALDVYYDREPPLEEVVLTARAVGGAPIMEPRVGSTDQGAQLLDGDERLRRALERLTAVDAERRRDWTREANRLAEASVSHGHPLDGVRPAEDSVEEPPENRLDLTAVERADPADDDLAGLAEIAAEQLWGAVREFEAKIRREDQRAQGEAFARGLDEGWERVRELSGQRGVGGRILHPDAAAYWKIARHRLTEVVKEIPACRALRPQERDDLGRLPERAPDATPAEIAALFTWDRAGRPGSLSTFGRHVAVSVGASRAAQLDSGRSLTG